ncbi:Competence protein A [Anaerococcus prevotii]|uniref:Two component transcriptional regulator, LuxR family n=1 Tax=Anaerococcus prevotii (strain ATCC 9321 / DSM 20548 / JCM 6508 / NCTC 11806 / PC1) TaxID=525919 RepID=C7REC7_ANAPD|nr:response regulator transcription factor [Anaerococcus prevotii]ACV29540.1 two component transcriptional regulator, LuxR family [Anaerococcus prevotii DSM 20548]SUU95214.1 Competence protein A [Anaerococcus prevotii]
MKIILLDDHKIFGQSLKILLEEEETIEVCDYISNIDDFLVRIDQDKYDILLIDINLKEEITGLDLIRNILSQNPKEKIIVLTSYDLANYKDIAFGLGVKDFINKSIERDDLIRMIKNVYQGKSKESTKSIKDPLTNRELEVLEELIKGSRKKDIAQKLYISERTLYNHIANIYEKLGAKNIVEAYNKAMELGYIYPFM